MLSPHAVPPSASWCHLLRHLLQEQIPRRLTQGSRDDGNGIDSVIIERVVQANSAQGYVRQRAH